MTSQHSTGGSTWDSSPPHTRGGWKGREFRMETPPVPVHHQSSHPLCGSFCLYHLPPSPEPKVRAQGTCLLFLPQPGTTRLAAPQTQ